MIRRLVEEQHVGLREQELRQFHAHQPAATEGRDGTRALVRCEAEAGKHALDTHVTLVAAGPVEARADLVVALREIRRDLVTVAAQAGHLGLELGAFGLEVVEVGERRRHLVVDRVGDRGVELLLQAADADAAGHRDPPGVGLLVAREHAQERRLAGSVGPHEADAVAGVDLQAHAREQDAIAQRSFQIFHPEKHARTLGNRLGATAPGVRKAGPPGGRFRGERTGGLSMDAEAVFNAGERGVHLLFEREVIHEAFDAKPSELRKVVSSRRTEIESVLVHILELESATHARELIAGQAREMQHVLVLLYFELLAGRALQRDCVVH